MLSNPGGGLSNIIVLGGPKLEKYRERLLKVRL